MSVLITHKRAIWVGPATPYAEFGHTGEARFRKFPFIASMDTTFYPDGVATPIMCAREEVFVKPEDLTKTIRKP